MRTPILSFALLLAGCAHALTAEEDLAATPAEFAAGRTFVEEQCGTCHSVSGQKQSSVRNAPPFSQLGRNYAISSLAEALAEGMITGHDSMPEWELAPGEIRGLLAYIQSVQRP